LFPGIHAAVAAGGTSALLIAAVVIDLVAIVAFFVSCLFGGGIQAPDAIAALRGQATVEAGISVEAVAVIAILIAGLA
jgi:hypothetical protein